MDPDELAALAVEVFGEDRVSVEPALDARHRGGAASWPRRTASPAAGVLVTGSVVTAGEARTLFGLEPA